jgi:hypothetical protein
MMRVKSVYTFLIAMTLICVACVRMAKPLFIAPIYVEYLSSSSDEFAKQVQTLRHTVGERNGIRVGFSTFLEMRYGNTDLNSAISRDVMQRTLDDIDVIVDRARINQLPVHISVVSGFFHGSNSLREAAIRSDVRNAQWFSDGWIADPQDIALSDEVPASAWTTPSRYAQPLRKRMEESVRIAGEQIASAMERFPNTLLNISGDTEVELSFARHLDSQGRGRTGGQIVYADYSPFMIAEFRDWLRQNRYTRDQSPATDDDHDGHTLNGDFGQEFRTWRLRYFDESGPIPFAQYRAMTERLPQSGPYFVDHGFDAPRVAQPNSKFWRTWQEFRVRAVANYLRDFADWITASSRIPPSRFFTHQIPAEYLFGGKDLTRLNMSASPLETAMITPLGSAGVTVFNVFNGKTYSKTSNIEMFRRLEGSGSDWGIVEYSPSVPATEDENYYLRELRSVYSFHPAIIAPFAWTTDPQHSRYRIQNTAYERALRKFIQEAGSDFHK